MPTIIIAEFEQVTPSGGVSKPPFPMTHSKPKDVAPTHVSPSLPIVKPQTEKMDVPEFQPVNEEARKQDPAPLTNKERHDAGLEALVQKFKEGRNGNKLTDAQNDIIQQVYDYPYEGTNISIGNYFKDVLRSKNRSKDRAGSEVSNFPMTDPTAATYELIRQALSTNNDIENLTASMKYLVGFYGLPPHKTGEERARLKMEDYVKWFNNPTLTTGVVEVEGGKEAAENGDWEQYKRLAWEQYKKDHWRDENGNDFDIAKSVAWILSEVYKNKKSLEALKDGRRLTPRESDPIENEKIRKLLENNIRERCAKAVQELSKSIAQENDPLKKSQLENELKNTKPPEKFDFRSMFEFLSSDIGEKLPDRSSLSLNPGQGIKIGHLAQLLATHGFASYNKKDKNTMAIEKYLQDGKEKTKQFKLPTLEMLSPGKQNLGPNYFDTIRNHAKPKVTTLNETITSEDGNDDNAHRMKHDFSKPTDAFDVSEPATVGDGYYDAPVAKPKPVALPKPSALPIQYFDFEGTDDDKAKAKARQDIVTPNNPKYKAIITSLANDLFDPTTDKLMHDACVMLGDIVDQNTGDLNEKKLARTQNSSMKAQFVRDHEAEMSALPGDDSRMKLMGLEKEVWKKILQRISDDAAYKKLTAQYGEPVMAAVKDHVRISLFAARTGLITG